MIFRKLYSANIIETFLGTNHAPPKHLFLDFLSSGKQLASEVFLMFSNNSSLEVLLPLEDLFRHALGLQLSPVDDSDVMWLTAH